MLNAISSKRLYWSYYVTMNGINSIRTPSLQFDTISKVVYINVSITNAIPMALQYIKLYLWEMSCVVMLRGPKEQDSVTDQANSQSCLKV